MAKRKPGKGKMRVDFRQNRQTPRRSGDLTRQYARDDDDVLNSISSESIRAKGDLSRKRTILVGESDKPLGAESEWLPGWVTIIHGRYCHVDDDQRRTWLCTVRRILRTRQIEQRAPVAVGDRVWISPATRTDAENPERPEREAVIERVEPRKTMLSRRERRGREHTLVANADQLLIVGSVAEPRLKPHLIDRYIVAALKGELVPIICLNKIDLLEEIVEEDSAGDDNSPDAANAAQVDDAEVAVEVEEDAEDEGAYWSLDDIADEWRRIGHKVILTSVATNTGVQELREALRDHITSISGQSGVGKSSLINAVQPGLNLAVSEVSRDTQKGRHTTTLARLMRLDFGGYVVDTPGIRTFDLWNVQPGELEAFFVEFLPFLPNCRWADCTHRHEEGCAVKAAVEAGEISSRRYASYLKMFAEV